MTQPTEMRIYRSNGVIDDYTDPTTEDLPVIDPGARMWGFASMIASLVIVIPIVAHFAGWLRVGLYGGAAGLFGVMPSVLYWRAVERRERKRAAIEIRLGKVIND
jgi:hypothetical protein